MAALKIPPGGTIVDGTRWNSKATALSIPITSLWRFVKIRQSVLEIMNKQQNQDGGTKNPTRGTIVDRTRWISKATALPIPVTSIWSFVKIRQSVLEIMNKQRNQDGGTRNPTRGHNCWRNALNFESNRSFHTNYKYIKFRQNPSKRSRNNE